MRVLLATEIFADALGDALVIDVGGATTDIHSVTDGSAEWTSHSIDPEPRAKRTVEGDLRTPLPEESLGRLGPMQFRKSLELAA